MGFNTLMSSNWCTKLIQTCGFLFRGNTHWQELWYRFVKLQCVCTPSPFPPKKSCYMPFICGLGLYIKDWSIKQRTTNSDIDTNSNNNTNTTNNVTAIQILRPKSWPQTSTNPAGGWFWWTSEANYSVDSYDVCCCLVIDVCCMLEGGLGGRLRRTIR